MLPLGQHACLSVSLRLLIVKKKKKKERGDIEKGQSAGDKWSDGNREKAREQAMT